ncbi:hypothetical protein AMECASPLE_032039, partial [Ameca splendens]
MLGINEPHKNSTTRVEINPHAEASLAAGVPPAAEEGVPPPSTVFNAGEGSSVLDIQPVKNYPEKIGITVPKDSPICGHLDSETDPTANANPGAAEAAAQPAGEGVAAQPAGE